MYVQHFDLNLVFDRDYPPVKGKQLDNLLVFVNVLIFCNYFFFIL